MQSNPRSSSVAVKALNLQYVNAHAMRATAAHQAVHAHTGLIWAASLASSLPGIKGIIHQGDAEGVIRGRVSRCHKDNILFSSLKELFSFK